jgi:uncharacterized protein
MPRRDSSTSLGSPRMDFFVYSRDAPGTEALRDDHDLLEEHSSYMDGFADTMIARGPMLATDRKAATGSLHVLGVPSLAAATELSSASRTTARVCTPSIEIWAFENLLGRTMWGLVGDAGEPRFLAIAHSGHDQRAPVSARPAAALAAELLERLIVLRRAG